MSLSPRAKAAMQKAASAKAATPDAAASVPDAAALAAAQAKLVENARLEAIASAITGNASENLDLIRADLSAVARVGEDGGYSSALQAASLIGLNVDALLAVNPSFKKSKDDNPVTLAVLAVHDAVSPNSGPTTRGALSRAVQCAVNATDRGLAATARIGLGTDDKPKHGHVPKPSVGNEAKAVHPTAAAARAEIDASYDKAGEAFDKLMQDCANAGVPVPQDAGEVVTHKQWSAAFRIASGDMADDDIVDTLRAMGRVKNTAEADASRFLGSLYLPLIADEIAEYVALDPVTKIGSLWQSLGTKARAAHKGYVTKCDDGKVQPTADGLATAISDAVTDVLAIELRTKVRAPKSDDAKIVSFKSQLYNALYGLQELGQLGSNEDASEIVAAIEELLASANVRDPAQERKEAQEAKRKAASDAAAARKAEKDAKKQAEKDAIAAAKAEADALTAKAKDDVSSEVDAAAKAAETAAADEAKFRANAAARAAARRAAKEAPAS
jgi:hypothetical protein